MSSPTFLSFQPKDLVTPQNSDLFGGGDAVVKYVLEGHDRGVNWAVRTFVWLLISHVSCMLQTVP